MNHTAKWFTYREVRNGNGKRQEYSKRNWMYREGEREGVGDKSGGRECVVRGRGEGSG